MNKNKYLPYFFVPLILVTVGACGEKSPPPPSVVPFVVTQKAQFGEAGAHASFAGEVRARTESALGFRVAGKIVERLVDVGAVVKAGTPLARIDARDLQLNTASVRSQLAAAQADVVQAQADNTRYHDLYQKKFVSAAEVDKRKATLDVAQARLDQVKAQLSVADNQNTYAVLHADRGGVITAVEAEVGQVVAAGQTVVRLARESEKEILITVPENGLPQLQSAPKIDLALWAAPDKRYTGKIREISPSADAVTRTYAVRIAVADADEAMRLGMTASVRVLQAGGATAAVLPLTALYQKGTNAALWVVDPASQVVKLTPVTVGAFREDTVTILTGIKDGDIVVTAGVHKLTQGQKVRVASEGPARK